MPAAADDPGETTGAAAERELLEETTLHGTAGRVLLRGTHNGRTATYFLMTDVTGEPEVSGPEAEAQAPDNRFELVWATAAEVTTLGLHPPHLRDDLPRLVDLA